jgi:HAD superfamily hydrolase (TIGR01509 family)
MALDAVIFDVDGTLVDTNRFHVEAWRRAFEQGGFNIPADRIAPEVGKGGDNLVPSILGNKAEQEHGEALRKICKQEFLKIAETEHFEIFPHVRELLQTLRERGIATAIATSANLENFEAIQKNAGIDFSQEVDCIITAADVEKSKPNPDLVIAAVQKLGLSPAQCVMIGDTPHDAEACRYAGVVCFGVLTSGMNTTNEELREAGARHVYRDMTDILEHLDEALQIASPGSAHLDSETLQQLMREALQVARDGMQNGEVPIGSVLADGSGKIIARGYNSMNHSQNKVAHAEIVTFQNAAGKVPLDARDLILVSTLEPCVMCTGAAMEAAVDTIIYALRAPHDSGTRRVRAPQSPESQMPRIVPDVLADKSHALLEEWLSQNADTDQAAFVKQLLDSV